MSNVESIPLSGKSDGGSRADHGQLGSNPSLGLSGSDLIAWVNVVSERTTA